MFDDITQIVSKYLTIDLTAEIKTPKMQLNFQKNNVSIIRTSFTMQDGAVNLPPVCNLLLKTGTNCQNSVVIQKVKIIFKIYEKYLMV